MQWAGGECWVDGPQNPVSDFLTTAGLLLHLFAYPFPLPFLCRHRAVLEA